MSSDAKIRGATEAGEGVAADLALEPASFNPSALDDLPSAESLAGDAITVDPRDPDWAPPAITNQWAGLVAGRGVFAYEGLSSPEHYAASEHGRLYVGLNGGPLTDLSGAEAGAAGGGAAEVTYRWYPSRIERSQQWRGVEFKVVTLLPGEKDVARSGTAVVNLLTVSNPGADDMNLDLMFLVSADTAGSWDTNWPPRDLLRASVSRDGDADLLLSDRESSVASAVVLGRPLIGVAGFDTQNGVGAKAFEGVDDPFAPTDHLVIPTEPEEPRWQQALADGQLDGQLAANAKRVALHVQLQVPAGGTADLTWVHAIGADGATASTLARRYLAESADLVATTRDAWEEEWRAAFDADSTRFSGHLPVLVSDQAAVTRIYYMGVLTLLYCRRAPVWGGRAITYITGFPSSLGTFPHTWVFPWDTMMVSGVLSLLDPKVMRELITSFLAADMHKGCAIDFGTGKPQGFWYAVNDYALIHMSWQYLRYTGDVALLAESVRGATVLDHLVDHAHYYRRLAGEDGLADYGTARNLLECVSSYTYKVASFNAANV